MTDNLEQTTSNGDDNRMQQFLPLAEKAHGVKNILQAVRGGMEVVDKALKKGDHERAARGWEILRDNISRISDLVVDMLEYSRESKLLLQEVNFNELIGSVTEQVRPRAGESDIAIKTAFDPGVGVLRLDPDKIVDVALNLIHNAIDAVRTGSGVVEISTNILADKNHYVLTVKDNGTGIADTQAIFRPFHSSKSTQGTGLGLSIAQKTIEQHKGWIDVDSEPGKGATFKVFLPCGL